MGFGKVGDAVLFGAAAALGSTIIAIIFRRTDSHHVVLPRADFLALPPLLRAVCIHPASCRISVVVVP